MLKVRRETRPRLVCWIVYRKLFLLEVNGPDKMSPPLKSLQWQLLKAICDSGVQHPATSLIVCWLTENCSPTTLFNSALQGSFPGGAGRREHTAARLGNLSSRKPTESSWVALSFVRVYYLSPDSIPTAAFLFSPGLSCLAGGPRNDHP